MAKYDIPQYPTKRLRYFNNQFLKEKDFIDDQAAHYAHERAQLRALCAPGVLEGLLVTPGEAGGPLQISAGVAVDRSGRLIVLDPAGTGPSPSGLSAGSYLLYIQFNEVAIFVGRRQHHHRDVPCVGIRFHPGEEFQAIDLGELQVEQNEPGHGLPGLRG